VDAIVDDLLDLMPDEIVVTPLTRTGSGKETAGTPVPFPAHVSGRIQLVKDPDGKIVKSSVQAIVAATGLSLTSRFTLPARFTPREPLALAIDRATDENGAHHETVYFA
jgi:hypothetical protein